MKYRKLFHLQASKPNFFSTRFLSRWNLSSGLFGRDTRVIHKAAPRNEFTRVRGRTKREECWRGALKRPPRGETARGVLSACHSSDRPVNIAKLKAHNLWPVWGLGAIPWIMAPLTRLELRRATPGPVLLRLFFCSFRFVLFLLAHPFGPTVRAPPFSPTYFRPATFTSDTTNCL